MALKAEPIQLKSIGKVEDKSDANICAKSSTETKRIENLKKIYMNWAILLDK